MGQRHSDLAGHAVEFVQLVEQFAGVGLALVHAGFHGLQARIPAEHALAHAVGVERGHHA